MTDSHQDLNTGKEANRENGFFASVIANLPQGIIVCNARGEILLYNKPVNAVLKLEEDHGSFPFLGQMVTALIDKNLIEHTLDEINERLKKNVLDTASYFIFRVHRNTVHARVTPMLDAAGQFKGFVLILEDITRQNEIDKKMEATLHSLAKNARSPIASIRAAIEAIMDYPGMDPARQDKFTEIIHNESLVLSNILNEVSENYTSLTGIQKSMETIPAADFFETIARRSGEKLDVQLNLEHIDTDIRIKADRYALTMVILFLLSQLKDKRGIQEFLGSVTISDGIVHIDLRWEGGALEADTIKNWEDRYPDISGQIFPLTLKEAINTNHAALWPFEAGDDSPMPYLRLLIPGDKPEDGQVVKPMTALPETQFEMYNPELFNKSGLDPELDNHLLTELNYTALIREISQAKTLEAVMGKHSQLPGLIYNMLTSGTKTKTVTWLITTFSDAILKKIIEFALNEQGPPPVSFAFITLGSEGRQEQTLKTDQDNAIVFEDINPGSGLMGKAVQHYFLELGEKICLWLDQAGYDLCLGGIMAKNEKWCQPLSTWKQYFTQWIRTAEPENLLHGTIFFDFRHAYGDNRLAEELRLHLAHALKERSGFLRFMTQNSLGFRPPIGFWGNFLVESKGTHKKSLDIKTCMAPMVDFARIYSLKNGITQTNTHSRLYQLYIKQVLNRDDYNEIEQAYSFLLQLRFMRQINAIIGENIKPDNYINPKKLSKIEQRMLKEVLKKIKLLQMRLTKEFITE